MLLLFYVVFNIIFLFKLVLRFVIINIFDNSSKTRINLITNNKQNDIYNFLTVQLKKSRINTVLGSQYTFLKKLYNTTTQSYTISIDFITAQRFEKKYAVAINILLLQRLYYINFNECSIIKVLFSLLVLQKYHEKAHFQKFINLDFLTDNIVYYNFLQKKIKITNNTIAHQNYFKINKNYNLKLVYDLDSFFKKTSSAIYLTKTLVTNITKKWVTRFYSSDVTKLLQTNHARQSIIYYLRKNKSFIKGRYSKNRAYYRTGVYWCMWVHIVAILGFYYWFYRFVLNFGYFWWLLYFFFFSFIFSRAVRAELFTLRFFIEVFNKNIFWMFQIFWSISFFIWSNFTIFIHKFFKLFNLAFKQQSKLVIFKYLILTLQIFQSYMVICKQVFVWNCSGINIDNKLSLQYFRKFSISIYQLFFILFK